MATGRESGLNNRGLDILHSIVREYIESGEPVASQTIARRCQHRLSAASIRNVMSDLSEAGYLAQPHTSAGRLPTEKAFRSYVQSLTRWRVVSAELQRLRQELSRVETVEARVEHSSRILTQMTRSMGIAAAIPNSSQTLDQIELVALAQRRVLMIVATRDRVIRNRVVSVDEAIHQDDLVSIRNYINRSFSGWTLSQIQSELARRLEQESAAFDEILRRLRTLYTKGLLDVDLSPEVHMEGASYLIGLDLHLTREKMRELFQTLEEKKRILHLLDRFLEQPSGELAVQIGVEDACSSMRELSLIGVKVAVGNGLAAKIAVLGPIRMNYEKAISAVLHMSEAFQSIPA